MSSLSNIYIKVETLELLLKTVKAKAEKGINIDISISDDSNQFDQNVSTYVSQTKEERDAKKPRFYVGNGRCFWTDGTIKTASKKVVIPAVPMTEEEHDDLPF